MEIVKVKQEELENLKELGFVDENETMVLPCDNGGSVVVDKETGIVGTLPAEGESAAVEENVVIVDLVNNGFAEIVNEDDGNIETAKDDIDGADSGEEKETEPGKDEQ